MPSGLLLDSTASYHMLADKDWFFKLKDMQNQYISVGRLTVANVGSITICTNIPGGINDIHFDDVLYMPKLGENLISLGLLQHNRAILQGLLYGMSLRQVVSSSQVNWRLENHVSCQMHEHRDLG